MKSNDKGLHDKSTKDKIPVALRCSKLAGLSHVVSDIGQIYFASDSNVYVVMAYFRSMKGTKDKSDSYYLVTKSGKILNAGASLKEVYDEHKSEDGILRLEICKYTAFGDWNL